MKAKGKTVGPIATGPTDPTLPQHAPRARDMRIAGETVSDEVIEAHVKRQEAEQARADRVKREKRTHPEKQTHAVNNETVHTQNESARQLDSRHEVERDSEVPTTWRPPSKLDAPPPRAGFRQRWIRYRADNVEDAEHFDECLDEGWRPRKRASARRVHELTAASHGKYGQYYVKRGLILMEIPEHLEVQRDRYFRNIQKNMNRGVDQNLFKVNHRLMPLLKPERSTRVSLRARRGRLEVPGDEAAADE